MNCILGASAAPFASVLLVECLFNLHCFTKQSLRFYSNHSKLFWEKADFFFSPVLGTLHQVGREKNGEGVLNAHCPLTRKLVTSPFKDVVGCVWQC